MKEIKGLNEAAKLIHEKAVKKGFWDEKIETGTLLMLCVSELSEALEADRKGKKAKLKGFYLDLERLKYANSESVENWGSINPLKQAFESHIKDTFEDEIADTMIRLLDLCGEKGIDIEAHIKLKLKYNETRGYKHGKKY